MSRTESSRPRDHIPQLNWREAGRWTIAAVLVLGAHLGAVALAMRDTASTPESPPASAAIMLELAPSPVAPAAPEQDIAKQETDAQQAVSDPLSQPIQPPDRTEAVRPVEEALAAPAEPIDEEVPEDETAAVQDNSPIQEMTPTFDDAVVALPPKAARPPRRAKKKEELRKQLRRVEHVKSASSTSATRASTRAPQARVAAAQQSSRGWLSSLSPSDWKSRLLAHLEREKRYPPSAQARGEQGTAYVRFRIDANGTVLSASLARSCGFPDLDREAVAMVRRASPVPAPPPDTNLFLTVPVRFAVH